MNFSEYTLLKQTHPPIKTLYLKGDNKLLLPTSLKVAIVGSRVISPHALKWLELNVPALVMNGITIISGGAFGVDYNSQQIALKHNGKVIAVIASGIENPTPKTNADFFAQVIQKGLLISEYPGKTPASKFAFVKRNRIIAALANLVLIVEAKEKSGALSTAEFALEMGITVACIPGRPSDELSKGTNNLIKSGAHLVQDYKDILSLLGCDSLNLFKRS